MPVFFYLWFLCFSLYGNTFDRGGWVLSFIKQNHQTALNNLPPPASPISSPALSNPEVSSPAHFPHKINLPAPSPAVKTSRLSSSPGVKAKLPTPSAACQPNLPDDILPPPPPIIRSISDHAVSPPPVFNASMQIDNDDLLPPPPPSISLISNSRCKSPRSSSERTLGRSSHQDISSFRSRSPIRSSSPTYSYQRQDNSPPRSSRQYNISPPHSSRQSMKSPVHTSRQSNNSPHRSSRQSFNSPPHGSRQSFNSPPHGPCHTYSSPPHKSRHPLNSSSSYNKSSPCDTSLSSRPFHDRPISGNSSSHDSSTPQYFGPPRNSSPPLRNSSPPLRNSSPPPRNSSPPPRKASPIRNSSPLRKSSPLQNSSSLQNSSPLRNPSPLRNSGSLGNSSPTWNSGPPLNSSPPQILSSDLMSTNDQCSSGLSSPEIISSVINTQQLEISARSDISREPVIELSPSPEPESTSPTYRLHDGQRIALSPLSLTEQDKHNFEKPQTPGIKFIL